jgi:Ca2+-binding RTX toxin-like protein
VRERTGGPRRRTLGRVRKIRIALVAVLGLGGFVPSAGSATAAAPSCGGLVATVVGTPGSDYLWGTSGPDVIAALGADDVVKGRGGDDVICGGPGMDVLNGQGGDDRVLGGHDRDVIESLRGSDELRGGPGDDDLISLSHKPARLHGGAGSDSLLGNVTSQPGYVFHGGGGGLDDLSLSARSAGALVEIRRGPGTISRDGAVTGRYRGNEFLVAGGLSPFSYFGTDERDFVILRRTALPFRAETFGGPDFVDSRATRADDYLDLGAGDDVAKAGQGHDTCLDAEKAKGCEVLSLSP